MKVQGIAESIVNHLVKRSNQIGQGRGLGAIGLVNQSGYIDALSPIEDAGVSGIPFRKILAQLVDLKGRSILEGVNCLPKNIVVIMTNPGKTGLIVSTGAINLFNAPIINIGIKNQKLVDVGILYPKADLFDLSSRSEQIQLEILAALSMEEERQLMKESSQLHLEYLDISQELPVVEEREREFQLSPESWSLERREVFSIDKKFADALVARSTSIEQGREVAAMGRVDQKGYVYQIGEIVIGGMGYVPSRLLASSFTNISGKALRQIYTEDIPNDAVIVHTHPGGTGVMHMGDAMAGPGTWGRPIIAIGHGSDGQLKGGTVIELAARVFDLADQYEDVGQRFFQATTPEEEAKIRKQRFTIVQEYTDLCKPIEIK